MKVAMDNTGSGYKDSIDTQFKGEKIHGENERPVKIKLKSITMPLTPPFRLPKTSEYETPFTTSYFKMKVRPAVTTFPFMESSLGTLVKHKKDKIKTYTLDDLFGTAKSGFREPITVKEDISEKIEGREIEGDKVSVELDSLEEGTLYVFKVRGRKFAIEKLSENEIRHLRLVEK